MNPSKISPAAALQLESRGFTILESPARLKERLEESYRHARRFFELSDPEKKTCEFDSLITGYRAEGAEYSQHPDRPDLSESFSVRAADQDKLGDRFTGPGLKLYESLFGVAIELDRLAGRLIEAVGHACDEEVTFTTDQGSWVQINRYQPSMQNRGLLLEEHEDGHLITLTTSTHPESLEIEQDGEYRPAEYRPGDFIVMPGELLYLLSGGRVKPLFHRVRTHENVSERFSVMYFVNPSPGASVRPWIENSVNHGIDIRERAIASSSRFGFPTL